MENTYLTALHGMEDVFENMDQLLDRFHKKYYMDAFTQFYESHFPAYQALEDGYHNAIDKEQYIKNMAEAVAGKAVSLLGREKKKAKKAQVSMNLNLFMVVYFLPSLKKYDGQLFLIYLLGYGAGRFWIEGLRTDQLLILGTQVAVSQVLSATVAIAAAVIMIVMFKKKKDAK